MKSQARSSFIIALRMLLVMTVVTGVVYPLFITGVAQLLFPTKAKGSILSVNGKEVGSELIAQKCDSNIYFHPRPSAGDYATLPSAASNKGAIAEESQTVVKQRETQFRSENTIPAAIAIPADMLFASASGVDPHISPEAAWLQVERVAAARAFTAEQRTKLSALLQQYTEPPQFGFLGNARVNVLKLNIALDALH